MSAVDLQSLLPSDHDLVTLFSPRIFINPGGLPVFLSSFAP
jgi:hypothetical protein